MNETTTAPLSSRSAVSRDTVGWNVWQRWTLCIAIGELVRFAAPALAIAMGTVGSWSDTAQVVAAVLAGAVEGAVLGFAQWLALHQSLPALSRRAWVVATSVGAMVAYLLAMLAVALGDVAQEQVGLLLVGALVLGIGFLSSIGVPQWLVLRRQLARSMASLMACDARQIFAMTANGIVVDW